MSDVDALYAGIREFPDYQGPVDETCDVVVVGSGPTGAVAAHRLTSAGLRVVLVEEGPVRRPRDFTEDGGRTLAEIFHEGGMRALRGPTVIPTLQARVLGGGSHVNSAICVRTPQFCFDTWRDHYGVTTIDRAALDPHYDRIERYLGIRPTEAHALGRRNQLFKQGCDALGISSEPCPRNVVDCGGCGECFTGCPTRAKRSADITYVPDAVAMGMRVLTSVQVRRLLHDGRRALGIEGVAIDPRTRQPGHAVRVRARAVVLAAGCLATPVLLQKSAVPDPHGLIGADLQAHPGWAFLGMFDEVVDPWIGATQGYQSLHYLDRGFKLEVLWAPPAVLAVRFPGFGHRFKDYLAAMRHSAPWDVFFALEHSRGRVRARRGDSMNPDASYCVADADMPRIREGLAMLARLFFAAGAKRLLAGIHGFPDVIERPEALSVDALRNVGPGDMVLSATHLFSTTRMGPDGAHGVVSEQGELFHLADCFIVDTGIMPKSPAVNPMLTGMALADRIAAGMVDRYGSSQSVPAAGR